VPSPSGQIHQSYCVWYRSRVSVLARYRQRAALPQHRVNSHQFRPRSRYPYPPALMKLSLVLAAAALAIPGLAAAVTAAPEITGVITPGHRQPFKPLPKNGTTHGLVNTTGSAVQTGAPVRSVWRPFADNPIQSPSRFKTGAAAFMAADVASQATPDSAQVPPQKLAKGKRDTFKKTALQNEGNNDPEEGTGIDKNKNDAVRRTAPHEIINLPTDLGTRSVGGKRPWARPSVGVDKGKAKQASAVVPKNASRKFRDALASKKAKASPQAPWTKMFDHRKGKTSSSPSDRKAKKTTRKNKTTRRSLAIAANVTSREPPETLSSDDTPPAPHPNQRRASDTPFGIKKGIVYQDGAVTPSFSRDGSATWAYNWGAAPGAPMFQQIPMFWGPRDKGDAAGVMALVRAGAPWVLGYNEPDMVWQGGGGCEVSAGEACEFLIPLLCGWWLGWC
jgi:hypothetical protein